MKRCICNTDPTVTCAGMKYYVSCPKCGLATDMYDTLDDAEKAWDARNVDMGKYTIEVKKPVPKEEGKEDKVVPKEEPKVAPKEDKVVPKEEPEDEPRPYKRRTRKEK